MPAPRRPSGSNAAARVGQEKRRLRIAKAWQAAIVSGRDAMDTEDPRPAAARIPTWPMLAYYLLFRRCISRMSLQLSASGSMPIIMSAWHISRICSRMC